MLRLENRMVKRLSLLLGCLVVFGAFLLAISQAKSGNALPAFAQNTGGSERALAVAVPQLPMAVSIGAYTAAGLPVSLAIGALKGDRGFSELPCRVSLASVSEVRRVNLALFEIEPTGKLFGAESWTQIFDPASIKTDDKTGTKFFDFDLRLRRPLSGRNAFVIALESVNGPAGTWETDFGTLMQTVVARLGGNLDAQAPVRQNADQKGGDYGSNYCARAFALASYLGRFSSHNGMPSFSCDKQLRNFSFTYFPPAKPATQTQ